MGIYREKEAERELEIEMEQERWMERERKIDMMYEWWCPFCGYFEDYPLVHDPNYAICPSCGRIVNKHDGVNEEEDM